MKGGDDVRLSNTSKRKQEMARRKEQRKLDLERKRKERGNQFYQCPYGVVVIPKILLAKIEKNIVLYIYRGDIVACSNCYSGHAIT